MANKTLAENVAQAKADFKGIKNMAKNVIKTDLGNRPTSEYAREIENGIYAYADGEYSRGIEEGSAQGYNVGLQYGIEQGKQEVISNSKYIEKSASGKVIRLDDVSEVAHKVKVKADTPTEVKVCGKNLFNNDTSLLKEVTHMGATQQVTRIGYEPLVLPSGTYTFTLKDLGTAIGKYIYGVINDKDGNYVAFCHLLADTDNKTPLTITVNEGDKIYIYDGNTPLNVSASAKRFNSVEIQLEVGYVSTPYESYKESQTIIATPNGVKISSNCPDMTFVADNDVTVDYYSSYGMQTEYDRFWDNYQAYGKRTNYSYAFCQTGWTNSNFQPKYDITLTSGAQMFYYTKITDLAGILKKQGVVMDSSKATSVIYMYGYSSLTRIPITDLSSATNTTYLCAGDTGLVSIEKIISSEKTVFANNTFNNCTALEHCIFDGTIASNINLQWSPKLDLESLMSLINCLKMYLDTGDEQWSKTITLSSESWALLDAQGEIFENVDGSPCTASTYVDNVRRWNIG